MAIGRAGEEEQEQQEQAIIMKRCSSLTGHGERLPAGKLPPAMLESYVLRYSGSLRKEVLVPAALGEDSAVIDFGGDLCVVSTDPITAATEDAGSLVVHVSCNDVAASGAEPVAMLLTILMPVGTSADWVKRLMEQVHRTASNLGVQVAGGHTEVTPGLVAPILCGTVLGRAKRDRIINSGGARPGDRLLMTRAAGIEGTAILAADYPDYCRSVLGDQGYARALAMSEEISVVQHALLARDAGATAMHDVTEGGILGAAYEMASAAHCGVVVDRDRVPVSAETKLLCRDLSIDPLRLISSGCLLIASRDPDKIKAALGEGVCTEIGWFTQEEMGLVEGGKTKKLDPPVGDELWSAKRTLEERKGARGPRG